MPTVREYAAVSQDSWPAFVVCSVGPITCSGATDWARLAWVRSWARQIIAMKRISWTRVRFGGWVAVAVRVIFLVRVRDVLLLRVGVGCVVGVGVVASGLI